MVSSRTMPFAKTFFIACGAEESLYSLRVNNQSNRPIIIKRETGIAFSEGSQCF